MAEAHAREGLSSRLRHPILQRFVLTVFVVGTLLAFAGYSPATAEQPDQCRGGNPHIWNNKCGILYICTIAGPSALYSYAVTSATTSQTVTVPTTECVFAGSFRIGTVVTVRESIPAGQRVTAISINPSARQVGSNNLQTGTAMLSIGVGVTEAWYSNSTS